MCGVCCAGSVMNAGEEGHRFSWDGVDNRQGVWVRARGFKYAEFTEGEVQVRRDGEEWPEEWTWAWDLAHVCSGLGLDIRWDCVGAEPMSVGLRVRPWLAGAIEVPEELPDGLWRWLAGDRYSEAKNRQWMNESNERKAKQVH